MRGGHNEVQMQERIDTPADRSVRDMRLEKPERDTEVVKTMDYKRVVPGESLPGNDGKRLHVTKAWKPKGRK